MKIRDLPQEVRDLLEAGEVLYSNRTDVRVITDRPGWVTLDAKGADLTAWDVAVLRLRKMDS